MSCCSRKTILAALSILWAASAPAETLRCQSVNGNLNCAGSGGVSCQTVNGRKVCTSGQGDVVQSFGGGQASTGDADADADAMGNGLDDTTPAPPIRQQFERRDRSGHTLRIERDGTKLHVQNDWLSIDRD